MTIHPKLTLYRFKKTHISDYSEEDRSFSGSPSSSAILFNQNL